MSVIRNLVVIGVSFALAYFGTTLVYHLFLGTLDYAVFAWIIASYTTIVAFFLTVFGGRHRFWWVALAIVPFFLIYLRLVLPPIEFITTSYNFLEASYFLAAWGVFLVTGLGLGYLANKILHKLVPGFMAKIG